MRLIKIEPLKPLTSGQEFSLTIQHTADAEGQVAAIRVRPGSIFTMTPAGKALEAGGSTTVTCKVIRRNPEESDPPSCLIEVRLEDSLSYASPEVA